MPEIRCFNEKYKNSQFYRSINNSESLSLEKINNFMTNYDAQIREICNNLNKYRCNKKLANYLIDKDTLNELHPIFKQHYLPHITKANGNCLFNMISISLIGNESLHGVLRALTVYTMVKNKTEFLSIIQRDINANNNDVEIFNKFNSILYEAKTDKFWCNEYHLLAISTFLNSELYIYGTFFNRTTGSLYQNASTVEDLEHIFNRSIRTGAHLIYRPLNCLLSDHNSMPLYGFFSSIRKHYTSIIPKSNRPPIFKPTNCIIAL